MYKFTFSPDLFRVSMNVATVACPETKRKKRSLIVDEDDAMEISFSKRSQV